MFISPDLQTATKSKSRYFGSGVFVYSELFNRVHCGWINVANIDFAPLYKHRNIIDKVIKHKFNKFAF